VGPRPRLRAQFQPELGRYLLGLAHAQLLSRLAQLGLQLPNPLPVIGHGRAGLVVCHAAVDSNTFEQCNSRGLRRPNCALLRGSRAGATLTGVGLSSRGRISSI